MRKNFLILMFLSVFFLSVTGDVRAFPDRDRLFEAIKQNDIHTVRVLIEKDPMLLTVRDRADLFPLHRASMLGRKEIVEFLLQRRANPNAQAEYSGLTALHIASLEGHMDVVQLLIRYFAQINMADNEGLTPLHIAAREGHPELVKFLLEKKGNPNARDNRGKTPLDLAVESGRRETAEFLRGQSSVSIMFSAIHAGKTEEVRALTRKDPGVLSVMGKYGNFEGMALHVAALLNRYEIAVILLDGGAPVNGRNPSGLTPLLVAASGRNVKILDLLLGRGADVSAVDEMGMTALHKASASGNKESVMMLLERGSEVNARDRWGRTPLYYAKARKHVDCILVLTNRGGKD